jgi:methylmalonyl-CoA epimerase
MIPIGDSRIELLEPLGPTTPVGKFIESRGEGIHHVAVEVDDVQRQLDDLAGKVVVLIDKAPRAGAHGKTIAFVHPKSTRGVLLELCQD